MKYNPDATYYKTLVGRDDNEYYGVYNGELYKTNTPVLYAEDITIQSIQNSETISSTVIAQYKLITLEISRTDIDSYKEGRFIAINWPDYQHYMEHKDWNKESVPDASTNRNVSRVLVPLYIINEIDRKDVKM